MLETEVFGALRDIRSLVEDARLSPVEKIDRIHVATFTKLDGSGHEIGRSALARAGRSSGG